MSLYIPTGMFKIKAEVYGQFNEDTLSKQFSGAGDRKKIATVYFADQDDLDFYSFNFSGLDTGEDRSLIAKRQSIWFRGALQEYEFEFTGDPPAESMNGVYKLSRLKKLAKTPYYECMFREV